MLTGEQRRRELESKGGFELLTGQKGISLIHEGAEGYPGLPRHYKLVIQLWGDSQKSLPRSSQAGWVLSRGQFRKASQ